MQPRSRTIAAWILRVLLAALFLMTGGHKLLGDRMMIDMVSKIGFGQGFRYMTGVLNLAAALLVLWPRTTFAAAMLMLAILAGAFLAKVFVLRGDVIHVIVLPPLSVCCCG